ncbi:MAG TPA: hypothetical protein VJ508_17225, partial [Saprospiraceae bacterium]|nr:hypothetical protein [Saprospiraceae bacterium]
VIVANLTWVAYNPVDPLINSLPPLRDGVLYPAYAEADRQGQLRLEHIHYVYARDYHWTTDLSILLEQWRRIGQSHDMPT